LPIDGELLLRRKRTHGVAHGSRRDCLVSCCTVRLRTCTISAKFSTRTTARVCGAAYHTRKRNGNFYPTHGLGPVAQYMGVHRGDRFDYMVSMSTPERGLTLWRDQTVKDKSDPKWKEHYIEGDLNSSLIKTVKGRTILLQHDVVNPRPYSRLNNVQGTKGIFNDYPPRVYLDGAKGGEKWSPLSDFKNDYAHPLWVHVGDLAKQLGGHGGMDFIMCYRLIQCMREGLAPDFDVYDAAAWSVPGPLSEKSVGQGQRTTEIPRFHARRVGYPSAVVVQNWLS